jgi:hypothetical protein
VVRLNGTVLDEFFRVKMRENFYDSVEAMQADLDAWLVHYNTERPHLGYRNMGRRPIETVMSPAKKVKWTDYIERFCSLRRRHSKRGYPCPMAFDSEAMQT